MACLQAGCQRQRPALAARSGLGSADRLPKAGVHVLAAVFRPGVRGAVRRKVRRLALALLSVLALYDAPAAAQEAGAQDTDAQGTLEVSKTGFDVKRPVLASACEHGCPWGELGDFVVEAMQPLGYEVILCRNCNKDQGPPIVAQASYPPPIGFLDTFVGTTTRVDAPVDFGITESGLLAWAYDGRYNYAQSGP